MALVCLQDGEGVREEYNLFAVYPSTHFNDLLQQKEKDEVKAISKKTSPARRGE